MDLRGMRFEKQVKVLVQFRLDGKCEHCFFISCSWREAPVSNVALMFVSSSENICEARQCCWFTWLDGHMWFRLYNRCLDHAKYLNSGYISSINGLVGGIALDWVAARRKMTTTNLHMYHFESADDLFSLELSSSSSTLVIYRATTYLLM